MGTLSVGSYTQIASGLGVALTPMSIGQLGVDVEMAIAAFKTTTNYYAVSLKLSGASVTVGAEDSIDSAAGSSLDSIDVIGQKADGSKAGIYYMDDVGGQHNNEVRVIDVNTTTLAQTVGAILEVPTDSGSQDRHTIDRISDTLSLIAHQKWVFGGGRLNAYKLTEAASVYTASAALTVDASTDNDRLIGSAILSSSRAFVFHRTETGQQMQVTLLDISGATPTIVDGPDTIEASSNTDNAHRQRRAVALSSTKAVFAFQTGSNIKLVVVENSADTINIGTLFTENSSGNRINSVAGRDSSSFFVSYRSSSQVETFSVSGTTITQDGNAISLPSSPTPSAIAESIATLVDTTGGLYEWIVVARDGNNDLWAARVVETPVVAMDTLTLAGSAETLAAVHTALPMSELTLASSAETITVIPILLDTLTLAGSAETLAVQPIALNTLTLASSPENLFPTIPVPMDTLTLAGSAETLGAVSVVVSIPMDSLTLAGSAEDLARVQVFLFSPTELTNLRETQHKTDLRMTIFQPPTLWTAQVNAPAGLDRGETDIPFDGGAGSLALVRDFQEIWIGTAPGTNDIAILRIDAIAGVLASGTVTIDENGIIWADNMYITGFHHYGIYRIPPRLFGGVLYRYFDVVYTNQNGQDNTEPVCVAGSDRVGELTGANIVFNFDLADGSYPTTSGALVSYTLTVAPAAGAVVAFNGGTGIGTVTLSTTGYWWATASCTDSLGNVMERFVLIRVHGTGDPEMLKVQLRSYQEQDGGGVSVSVEAREDVTLSDIPDNAIAILWHDNYFDNVAGNVNILGTGDNVLLDGYVRRDNNQDDFSTGDGPATFNLTTVDGLAQNLPMRGIPLRLKSGAPTDWYEYQLLTTGEAIWFLFRWHSTVPWRHDMIGLKDFDSSRRRRNADFEEGNLFSMANQLGFERGVRAKLSCDRLGRIHFYQDSQLLNQSDRDGLINIMDITEDDTSGVIGLVRDPEQGTYTVQVSGFAYTSSGVGTPYISIIPGYRPASISFSVPEHRGSNMLNKPNQLLASQVESNQVVGRYAAEANRPIKEIRINFRGNYLTALTTINSFGWYEMGIQDTSLARELDINTLRLLCRSINAQFENGLLRVSAVFHPEAQGPNGIQGNYPTSMARPFIEAPPVEIEEPGEGMFASTSMNWRQFNPDDVLWTQLQAVAYTHAIIDTWWQISNQSVDPANIIWWASTTGNIFKASTRDGTPVDVSPTNDPPNTWSDAPAPTVADLDFFFLLSDRFIQNRIFALANWQNGSDEWRCWMIYTVDGGTTWTWYDFYDGYALPNSAKARGIAINGTYILMTLWEELVGIRLYEVSASDFSNLGRQTASASLSNPDGVNWFWPVTVVDNDNLWWLHGHMTAPLGVVQTNVQAIVSNDAGSTWSAFETQWGGGPCYTLVVGDADALGNRRVWGWR